MDLPPTIPTSFVPHSAAMAQRGFRFDFMSAFGVFAYLVFFVVAGLAVGVFIYSSMLETTRDSMSAQLKKVEESIEKNTAEDFVRLHNRLSSGKTLLANHVAFSNFFTTLSANLPVTVRFSTLHVSNRDDGRVVLEGSGVAKNFNALAALSKEFAAKGQIKDAIFSRISVNKDNSVTFALAAVIDAELVAFSAAAPPPAESESTAVPPSAP